MSVSMSMFSALSRYWRRHTFSTPKKNELTTSVEAMVIGPFSG